jgi:predicted histone-like DNA-binding protein
VIKLKTIQRPNPKDLTAERKYYVSAQNSGEVSLEEMSENISDRCTLTETDVLAALSALQREMTRNMMAGKIVRFGTFGSFQLTLNSSGVENIADTSQNQVKGVRVRFRPGTRIQENLRNLKYTLTAE